jgi:repressor LexA
MAVDQLHSKRLEILSLLARREGTAGRTPSIREIAEAVGLKSSQTVHHHLNRLEGSGYLERLDDRPRTPKLTEKGWGAVLDGGTPLLGRIAAGRGLEAVAAATRRTLWPPSSCCRTRAEGGTCCGWWAKA